VKKSRNHVQSPAKKQTEEAREPTRNSPQHTQTFSISDLKRAVCNNLPCFFIKFDTAEEGTWAPSCTQIAIMLKKLFVDSNIPVKELSTCVPAGEHRFKFAVQGKSEFLQLYNWNWPEQVDQKRIEITKPRSLPDCLALVVRYIPKDVSIVNAQREIFKAIPSAVSFSTILCQYRKRPSYDIRFIVRDLEQYQTAVELGRIAIGHHYLPTMPFLSGNKLTYCTACWKLGHMRDKCKFLSAAVNA
jgi:hypothetical protein